MNKSFRLDIQGLRAVAVLLVFLSHAGIIQFAGGYIGVDVFFVISGYVISLLLFKEYHVNGGIKLIDFYGKRILRLLPALLFLVVLSLLIAPLILIPLEQVAQYDAATAAISWLSNIYFYYYEFDYFSPLIQESLFLHTWSLGVEEQFYLIWPLIILWSLSKTKHMEPIQFLYVIGFVAFLSVLFQVAVSFESNTSAFYLMPARVWQFALGAVIAYIRIHRMFDCENLKQSLLQLGGVIGLILIVFSSMYFDSDTSYPSWRVAIPSLGTAMVLFFYNAKVTTVTSFLLSNKLMVWLGNISYSFYLWHWVVLFIFHKLELFMPQLNLWLAFIVTLLMACFSYYLIEMPLRHNKKLIKKPRLVLLMALSMIAIFGVSLNSLEKDAVLASDDPEFNELKKVRRDVPELYKLNCDTWHHSSDVTACGFGNTSGQKTVVLFGDSVLAQWYPLIAEVYSAFEWKIIVVTKSACPLVDEPFFYKRINREYKVCERWRNQAIQYLQAIKPDVLVMGSASEYPYSKEEWQNGSYSVISELAEHVGEIKLIAATPEIGFNVPNCLTRVSWVNSWLPDAHDGLCKKPLNAHVTWQYLNEVAEKFNNVSFLNFRAAICPEDICTAKLNGLVTYRDDKHLSSTFVKSLASKLKVKFNLNSSD